jgi:hypothetical protein
MVPAAILIPRSCTRPVADLAIAGCVSNDLFREARVDGIELATVRVVVAVRALNLVGLLSFYAEGPPGS